MASRIAKDEAASDGQEIRRERIGAAALRELVDLHRRVAPAMERILIDTVRGLAHEGVGFLVIEHDLEVIAALCEHVYVMAGGKILTAGTFAEVTANERVVEPYLGLKR